MTVDIESLPCEAKKALQQFSEFQLAEFNDSGANGYVMIGRHDVLRKDVAIKIYFHEANDVDQEPAIIATLNHENILKVFDARKVENCCSFYMMQAANDGDLFTFQKRYHLSLDLSNKLLCQLLSGLSAMHCPDKQLVHRDLKPENLLVHDDQLVIADFGSVRRIDEATGKAPASKHSILYRPPEAFGDNAFFDFSSDVYQAGLIAYLLFGGLLSNDLLEHLNNNELNNFEKVKLTGDGFEESKFVDACIEKRIKSGKLLDWSSIPFYVPKKIIRVIKKATLNHGKRYSNVSEFLAELAKVRAGLPDWIASQEGYQLRNWKGNDYLLVNIDGKITLKKRKHKSKLFRVDHSVKESDINSAFNKLKIKIGLP
ncbi:protein kinase [Shewanella sp. Scap07]|uniref:protein kinase domain-containing protein n=1 Tax=Shewanella sp. Scap07 TaxID=2589987 RepID=UPI0015C01495|nr:protein kinase [Shewanella sp. Scap07]QLE85349.1 protein kinase [Shewanella sp. Scap07]